MQGDPFCASLHFLRGPVAFDLSKKFCKSTKALVGTGGSRRDASGTLGELLLIFILRTKKCRFFFQAESCFLTGFFFFPLPSGSERAFYSFALNALLIFHEGTCNCWRGYLGAGEGGQFMTPVSMMSPITQIAPSHRFGVIGAYNKQP